MPPNPGSAEAIAQGCTCPVLDNSHGRGVVLDGDTGQRLFWHSADCPLHGMNETERLIDVLNRLGEA